MQITYYCPKCGKFVTTEPFSLLKETSSHIRYGCECPFCSFLGNVEVKREDMKFPVEVPQKAFKQSGQSTPQGASNPVNPPP